MKKQDTGKKPIKWIVLAVVLVVAAIGVALALTVFSGNSGGESALDGFIGRTAVFEPG